MRFVKGVAVGLIAGAVAGMMILPQTRRKTSRIVRSKADKAIKKIGNIVNDFSDIIAGE